MSADPCLRLAHTLEFKLDLELAIHEKLPLLFEATQFGTSQNTPGDPHSLDGPRGASAVSAEAPALYYRHAQHLLLNGHSLHCHPTTGWNTPASSAASTFAAIRTSRMFVARSRVVQ